MNCWGVEVEGVLQPADSEMDGGYLEDHPRAKIPVRAC